jgi:hypothetical protein
VPGAAKDSIVQLDGYARCMRTHGVPGFYLSTQTDAPAQQQLLRRLIKGAACIRSRG